MNKVTITDWDPAEHITTPEHVFAYIEAALEEDDPAFFLKTMGYIARSKGMTQLAKELGVTRERLYTSLSPKGNPSFKTISTTLKIFGLQLTVKPIAPLNLKPKRAAKTRAATAPQRTTARSPKKRMAVAQ